MFKETGRVVNEGEMATAAASISKRFTCSSCGQDTAVSNVVFDAMYKCSHCGEEKGLYENV